MIPRLSYTNIAIMGLLQIATVVAGVLGAGAAYKVWSSTGAGLPHDPAVVFASEYGFHFLAVPLTWITVAMAVQARDRTGDAPESVTFLTGLVIWVIMVIAAWKVAVAPLMRALLGGCGMTLAS